MAKSKEISRRSFLNLAGVTAAAISVSGGLSGCGKGGPEKTISDTGNTDKNRIVGQPHQYTVIPTAGHNNCGGRCVIKSYVEDGSVVKLGTDDGSDEAPNRPQLRACPIGRSYRKTFLSADRLKYPMKRVGKRGEGEFEQISWEEAIDLIVSENNRIKHTYGPESRYVMYAWGYSAQISPLNLVKRLLALDGGYLDYYNTYSTACTACATPYTYGTTSSGSSLQSLLDSDLIILWGLNSAETVYGSMFNYILRQAKEKGVRIISIDPRGTGLLSGIVDEWIPIRPTTDNAMMDAMAYVMIVENIYDQEFLDKYCLGFDSDHMPKGYEDEESYKDYVLGTRDGVAKTPEWASTITGVSAEKITELARAYANASAAALMEGYGLQRHAYGEQPPRGGACLACMTGNVGRSGGWASGAAYMCYWNSVGSISAGDNPVTFKIPCFKWTDAVVRGTEMDTVHDGVISGDKVFSMADLIAAGGSDATADSVNVRLPSNIKMIWNLSGNTLINQHSDCNKTAEILKDENLVEFIVCSDIFMTPSAKFADVLLPGVSMFEEDNLLLDSYNSDYVLMGNKSIDPLFECRHELDWLADVAEKLGVKDEFTEGHESAIDWIEDWVNDLQEEHEDFPTFEEFKKEGKYWFDRDSRVIAFKDQIDNPKDNPFPTPSGKIELFSPRLFDMGRPDEIPALAKYIPAWEGPFDVLTEIYPLQCIGYHTKRRVHSVHDNNSWLEEIEPQHLMISMTDAKNRGITDGDIVEVFNDRGRVRIPARVVETIMPGVVAVPEGAWYTPDDAGVDIRGNINTLTTHRTTPLAFGNPQHTNLVEVEAL